LRSSVLPLSRRAVAAHSAHARRQALISLDDHGTGAKLILIEVDHGLMIMEEGLGGR
jgi:hypothetical protein